MVEPLGERFHDPRHAGQQHRHDQGELPVGIEQVKQQCNHRETVARKHQKRLHDQGGAILYLVHHGIGQRTGRLFGKQAQVGIQHAIEQVLA
ncbi:hypothetical protein D3C72_1896730 [compost metagenome]